MKPALVPRSSTKRVLLLDVRCPAELELEAGAVIKADEAHCKVLNVEGTVCNSFTELRVLGIALSLIVCKLGVGAARKPATGVGLPMSQMERSIM